MSTFSLLSKRKQALESNVGGSSTSVFSSSSSSSSNPFASTSKKSKKDAPSPQSSGGIFGEQVESPKFTFAQPTFQVPSFDATAAKDSAAEKTDDEKEAGATLKVPNEHSLRLSSSAVASLSPIPSSAPSSASPGSANDTAGKKAMEKSPSAPPTVPLQPERIVKIPVAKSESFASIAEKKQSKSASGEVASLELAQEASSSASFVAAGSKFGANLSPFKFKPATSKEEDKAALSSDERKTAAAAAAPKTENLLTGEENEVVQFQTRAKLYAIDKRTSNEWVERGIGMLKVNKSKERPARFRLLMRQEGVFRLLLNVGVWADMSIQVISEKSLRFLAFEDGEPKSFLLRVAKKEDADSLLAAIEKAKSQSTMARDTK